MRGVSLTVVSNDPAAGACAEQGRISVVRGITDPAALSSIYSGAHLLVHPTRFDLYSHVICEGLAHGLPFAVSANTPAAELVAESGAGVLIAPPVSADSIATAIRAATEPSGYARREAAALSFAQRCLRMEHLAELVRAALDAAAR
jgi:glycosyltransferase involved in cell wall biosynthesis